MRKRLYFSLLATVLGMGGCAIGQPVNLVENGTTVVDTHSSANGEIVNAKVEQYGEDVLVRGRVAKDEERRLLKGYVQVDVFDKNGVRIDSVSSLYRFSHNTSRSANTAPFSAKLHVVPPAGSHVMINHRDSRDGRKDNSAVLSIM